MNKFHSTMTRRDFMKVLGVSAAGLGAAGAAGAHSRHDPRSDPVAPARVSGRLAGPPVHGARVADRKQGAACAVRLRGYAA